MQKILKSKYLWIFIISIITTINISINVVNGVFDFESNDFKWILLLCILCVIFSKALEKTNKRVLLYARNI